MSIYGLMKLLELENVNEYLVFVIGGKGGKDFFFLFVYIKLKKCEFMFGECDFKFLFKIWIDMVM